MGVRRHRVPYSTRIQLSETQLQLTRTFLQHIVHDELVNGAIVSLLYSSYRTPYSSLQRTLTSVEGDPLSLIVLMGCGRVQIELGRILRILRAELNLLVHILILTNMATTDIKSLLRREGILLTIHDDYAIALTTVYYA